MIGTKASQLELEERSRAGGLEVVSISITVNNLPNSKEYRKPSRQNKQPCHSYRYLIDNLLINAW